ncbi:MAG: tetratricopeptide repeat protein [Saprospiraceae bacterium]|nr:tetratricopeptide repeat protein [Saprospiraceae bacterium]
MAKVIQYKADTSRKPGFRKVRRARKGTNPDQLNLFAEESATSVHKHVLRHLDPFEKGLQIDGRNDELAERFYREAIDSGVSVADAFCNLAIISARKGDTVMAIDQLTQALKADPRHTAAHYNLANMYYDAGNFPLAKVHYEIAIQLEDSFSQIIYNLALTCICLHEQDEAIAHLKEYIAATEPEQHEEAEHLIKVLSLQKS